MNSDVASTQKYKSHQWLMPSFFPPEAVFERQENMLMTTMWLSAEEMQTS